MYDDYDDYFYSHLSRFDQDDYSSYASYMSGEDGPDGSLPMDCAPLYTECGTKRLGYSVGDFDNQEGDS